MAKYFLSFLTIMLFCVEVSAAVDTGKNRITQRKVITHTKSTDIESNNRQIQTIGSQESIHERTKHNTRNQILNSIDNLESEKGVELDLLDVIIELDAPPLSTQIRQLKQHSKTSAFNNTQQINQRTQNLDLVQSDLIKNILQKGLVHSVGRQFKYLFNGISAKINKKDFRALKNFSNIKKIHVVSMNTIHLTQSVPLINAEQVWALKDSNGLNITGAGAKVAIVDTGIDYTHPDLGGCFGANCRVIDGFDFVNDDNDPMDDNSHGTHVAGIVAANGTLKGVAPDATLYAYKVCTEFGSCPTEFIMAALEKAADLDANPATDDHVDIINISLGGPGEIDSPLTQAVNEAALKGIVVVVSAGNEGSSGLQTIGTPGNAELALSVGATDKNDTVTNFSSRGPLASEIFQKPDLTAPGYQITSLSLNHEFANKSGTSMAAPHVAGVAALLKQQYPNISAQQIKSKIVNSAENIGQDYVTTGNGRVNALRAVESTMALNQTSLVFGRIVRSNGEWQNIQTVEVFNSSNQELEVTASINSNLSDNISFSITGNPEFSIAANSSKTLDVLLNVNTINLSFPDTLLHTAKLSLVSTQDSLSIPLIIIDAVKLNWSVDTFSNWVWVNNTSGKASFVKEFVISGSQFLFPGSHTIAAMMDTGEKVSWVVKELDNLAQDGVIEMKASDATNQIQLTDFIDYTGSSRDVSDLFGGAVFMELAHPQSRYRQASFFLSGDSREFINRSVFVSDISEQFEFNFSLLFGDKTMPSNDYHVYSYSKSLKGINQDLNITLDGTLDNKVKFDIEIPELTGEEIQWALSGNLLLGNYHTSGAYTSGRGFIGPGFMASSDNTQFFTSNFKLTLHGNENVHNRFGIYALWPFADFGNPYRAPLIQFKANSSYSIAKRFYDNGDFVETGFSSPDPKYKFNGEGIFPINFFQPWTTEKNLVSSTFGGDLYSTYSESFHSKWLLECENTAVSGSADNFFIYDIGLQNNCSQLKAHQRYKNYLFGQAAMSSSTLTINSNIFITDLNLNELLKHNNDNESLSHASAKLHLFKVHHDNGIFNAYINYQGSWQPINTLELNVEADGANNFVFVDYQLEFPVLNEALVTSLKLEFRDNNNLFSKTISNAFILGGNKEDIMSLDRDNDGIPDGLDTDKDNDGIPDGIEIINNLNHLDATDAELDLDGDGFSNIDEYQLGRSIAFIEIDTDGDGFTDDQDAFPLDPSESIDTDNDGIGNNADTDDDNDAVLDDEDAFPLDPTESADTDNDGIGNNADTDDDNDGVLDSNDAFPLDPTESVDTDSDGIGNNADTDDDNDGVLDSIDAFPLDPTESVDTDNDGIGNNTDSDDDGDGVLDSNDAFPLDPSRSSNGNNASSGGGGGSIPLSQISILLLIFWVRKRALNNYLKLQQRIL